MAATGATTVIPGCQNLTGYWAPGHGILVHTSDGRPRTSQSSTHYRYPVLHEVRWGADFQSVITRKLINETHAIFMDLQHVPDGGGTGRKASLIKFSRRYRSVVRACILDLEEKSAFRESSTGARYPHSTPDGPLGSHADLTFTYVTVDPTLWV
ncbi:nuclear pore complex protein Nup85-like [Orbicella faveolata]|uniref:nuclear pore complex protein Nup85-like n=1 Tax=Orbicella faveolata TaxID=48498 RepID=UPI0009E61B0F|nr:nuclear pore complex protein Nup85-like [Orbicella faveolata]